MTPFGGPSLPVFFGFTVILVGGVGVLTGQALARAWRPPMQVALACVGLGFVDRFLVYGLFGGELLSIQGFLTDTLVIMVLGLTAFHLARVSKMVEQYPWLYERASVWAYRLKK